MRLLNRAMLFASPSISNPLWVLRRRTPDAEAAWRILRSISLFMSHVMAFARERPFENVLPLYFILSIVQPFGGYLTLSGTGYVYRETIQTQPDPRREGKWRIENGQLCFPALADECFAIEQAGPNLHRLVLQDATKSWQPNLVPTAPRDVLGLRRAQSFYDWEPHHRRIGETLLFLPLGTQLFNGAANEEGEIVS